MARPDGVMAVGRKSIMKDHEDRARTNNDIVVIWHRRSIEQAAQPAVSGLCDDPRPARRLPPPSPIAPPPCVVVSPSINAGGAAVGADRGDQGAPARHG